MLNTSFVSYANIGNGKTKYYCSMNSHFTRYDHYFNLHNIFIDFSIEYKQIFEFFYEL